MKIRITTDDVYVVEELCSHALSWAYVQEGELTEFLTPEVDFHVYLDTYQKAQNVRDFIRRKIGNGNEKYSMKKSKPLPLEYLAYMMKGEKKGYIFKHFNISAEVLKEAQVYDETVKNEVAVKHGILSAEFKSLLPAKPSDLDLRELILRYYHENHKPFDHAMMKAQYEHLRYHYKLAPKSLFLSIFD